MKNIIWGVVALVIVILGIWFFTMRDESSLVNDNAETANSTTTTDGTNTDTGTTVVATKKEATFKSLLAENGNFQCKYESVDPSYRSTNMVYFSDGKLRGEFRTTSSAGSIANMVVYDGLNMYVWKEGMNTGTRTQPKTLADLPDVIPADISSAAIFGTSPKNVSWDCYPWSTDATLLTKPAGVTFN